MRHRSITAILISIAALGACSGAPSEQTAQEQADQEGAPAVDVSAAPGVAFDYHYAFSLPAARISAAQEAHAAACEQLSLARCRITGMRYKLLGDNRAEGMLAFKLDPTVARAFGKTGIAAVEKGEGRLIDAEVSGVDVGTDIAHLASGRTRAQAELARIDTALARTNIPSGERSELQRQRAALVERLEANRATSADKTESLATTPMVFDYRSGPAIRGIDVGAPLSGAVDLLFRSAQATLAFILGAIAIFGPPALALLLLWLIWRRARPRLRFARD